MSVNVIVLSLHYLCLRHDQFFFEVKMDDSFIGMFVLMVFAKSGSKGKNLELCFYLLFWKSIKLQNKQILEYCTVDSFLK